MPLTSRASRHRVAPLANTLRRHSSLANRAVRDADHLAIVYQRAAQRVRDQRLRRTADVPVTDPRAVHDLRVASRRLSSALRVWRPALHTSERRAAARALRRIRRAFGPVRDIEVHLEQIAAHRAAVLDRTPTALAALTALERSLRHRYARARAVARATLRSRRVHNVARDVARAFADARHRLTKPHTRARVAAPLQIVRTEALHAIRAACRRGLATDDATFHRVRIAIKKWRYAAERIAKVGGETPTPRGRLRALQSALGEAHDAITLDAEIARFTARSSRRRAALAPLSARLRETAAQHIAHFLKRGRLLNATRARAVSSRKPASPGAGSSRGSSRGR